MSNIDKQWLQRKIANMEATRDEIPFGLDEDDSNMLAALRIALASLEAEKSAEPVAFINGAWTLVYYRPPKELGLKIGDKLYAAQPAPASVPDELADAVNGLLDAMDEYPESLVPINRDSAVVRQLRAAMLQGADGNSPVIPDGWVLVPVEPTYQMCKAMGLPWESPRFPDRYKAMISAAKNDS